MKKISILILGLITILTPQKFVYAESSCSYSEQVEFNNLAANVQGTYEAVDIYNGKSINVDSEDEEEVDSYVRGLRISILNITDDIYIKLIDSNSKNERTYYYKDTNDGVLTFDVSDVFAVTEYTVEVYANKHSCAGELYRTFTFTTPRYNYYSAMDICKDNPGFYYCQEFVQSTEIGIDNFYNMLENYAKEEEQKQEEENKNLWDKIKDFYKEHTVAVNIGASVLVIVGVTSTVILVKKRRSRVL